MAQIHVTTMRETMKKTSHFSVKRWMKFGTVSPIFARKSRESSPEKVRYSNSAPRFQCATGHKWLTGKKLGQPTRTDAGTDVRACAIAHPCARLPASARSHPVAVTGISKRSRIVINPNGQKPVRSKL